MKIKFMLLPALLATAAIAAPAMANGTIILPNDVTVPYAGTGEPTFSTVGGGVTGYWVAADSGSGNSYFYTIDGDWVAVLGPTASSVPNAPALLTTAISPITGQTLPISTTDGFLFSAIPATGGYQVFDVNSGNIYTYSASDELLGTERAQGSPTLTGSSSFGGSTGGTTTTSSTTSGGSSSFGGTSGGSTTTSGGSTTSGGATTSGGSTGGSGGSTGGGTDIPAPAVLGLFGMAAGGLALARRRRRQSGN